MNRSNSTISQNLLPFIPLLYVAWADDVLSPTEIELIEKKINRLSHLSAEDLKQLREWINPKTNISEETFSAWKEALTNSLNSEQINTLGINELSMAMSTDSNPSTDIHELNPATKEALSDLERIWSVGILDLPRTIRKSMNIAASHDNFNTNDITAALNGVDNDIINKTKTLLQDPIFSYQTLRTKEEYRAQVLKWTKFLADQGFGALSFPKAYGGQDDIQSYAAVFETLGFHDFEFSH